MEFLALKNVSEDEKMVQYYVYLEFLKRLKDEENEIMKSLAFRVTKYQESLVTYLDLYRKYTHLIQLMQTNNVLQNMDQKTVEQGIHNSNITRMIQQLKSNMNSEQIDSDQLSRMKEFLVQFTDFHKTKKIFQNTQLKDGKSKGIDQSLNRIEADTRSSIDILVKQILENFHKILDPFEE